MAQNSGLRAGPGSEEGSVGRVICACRYVDAFIFAHPVSALREEIASMQMRCMQMRYPQMKSLYANDTYYMQEGLTKLSLIRLQVLTVCRPDSGYSREQHKAGPDSGKQKSRRGGGCGIDGTHSL